MARLWKFPANVDTDQMVPGRYAPYMRPGKDVGDAAFIEADPQFNREAKPGDIIVAGANFGCGSSREYAPLALKRRGIAAIIAPGFARIFFRNAINLGLPLFISAELTNRVKGGEAVIFDRAQSQLCFDGRVFALPSLPRFTQSIIDEGGIVAYFKRHGRLPPHEGLDEGTGHSSGGNNT